MTSPLCFEASNAAEIKIADHKFEEMKQKKNVLQGGEFSATLGFL